MALEEDISALTELVQGMLAESGEQTGFDAKAWLDRCLTGVVPALGNRRPIDVLNEPDGPEIVKSFSCKPNPVRTREHRQESGLVVSQVWARRCPR